MTASGRALWASVAVWAAAAACGKGTEVQGAAVPPPATSQGNLRMEIQGITLPEGAGARPVVRFRVTDAQGNPIDLKAEIASANTTPPTVPNTVPRFTLAARDARNDYRSYYASTANPRSYTVPDGYVAPPSTPRLQAAYQPPARTATGQAAPWPVDADLRAVGGGVYEYTMPPVNQTGFDRTQTHTVAGWAVRSNGTADADVAAATLDFVPAGGSPGGYATVTDARCNQCHGFVQAHGTRRSVPLCITCHNPSTGDPETSQTVDFKVMIHKIHAGSTLPSVLQGEADRAAGRPGKAYFIVAFNQAVADFTDIVFPYHDHGVRHCTVCHAGGAQSDNWRRVPTVAVCTSCHDNVQFNPAAGLDPCPVGTAAGTSFKDCFHTGGPVSMTDDRDSGACVGCHGAGAQFAIDRYHHGD